MGSVISYLWWGGYDPDAVDPESGLSRRDIYLVRKSWAKVTADSVGSGTELLIRYFTEFPDNKKSFRTFKDLENESLRTNRQFNAHALSVVTGLTSIIDNLDKPDLAVEICRKLGSSHNNRRITQFQFENLKQTIVKLFTEVLHFDEDTMASWVRAVTFIYTNLFKEIENKM